MQVSAVLRNAELSPQKVRLVAKEIRGMNVEPALEKLSFIPKKAAKVLKKLLESALANAEHNEGADIDELRISKLCVDKASVLKRFRPRAKGRANRIIKHRCHIQIEVADKEQKGE